MKYYLPIPLIGNLLFTFQWYLLIDKTFTRRYSRLVTFSAELAVFAVHICLGTFLPYMSMIRSIYVPFLFAGAFLLLYQGRWQKILFATAGLWTIQYMTELINFLILYAPEVLEAKLDNLKPFFLIKLYIQTNAISAVQVWLLYLLINRKKNRLTMIQWGLCAVFLLSQGGVLFNYLRILALNPMMKNTLYLIVLISACIVLNIFLVQYVLSLSRRERLRAENRMLSAQIDAQLQHYSTIAEQYETIRKIWHDISKHLVAMERMLQDGHSTQAEEYIAKLRENIYAMQPPLCRNLAVDALLRSYREKAQEENVSITFQVQIPDDIGIDNTDLICAFGNLLDNAFEACTGHPAPQIRLFSARAKNYLVISLDNSIGNIPEKKPHGYGIERGIGTQILNHLAEKYNGTYETRTDGQQFFAYLCLGAKEGRDHDVLRSLR